jgi:hypothetical protein
MARFTCVVSWVLMFTITVPAKTVERSDLEQLFKPEAKGWLGADVALSIPLGEIGCAGYNGKCSKGATYLWVWGDTLVGSLVAGDRNITRMPHDSFGLVSFPETKTELSPEANITLPFLSKAAEDLPNEPEFFIPDSNAGFFRPPTEAGPPYYWVVAGMVGPTEMMQKLFFIAMRIQSISSGLGFEQVGSDVIVVDDYKTSIGGESGFIAPANWTYKTRTLPNSNRNCTWNSGVTIAAGDGRKQNPSGSPDYAAFVYIVGRCLWSDRGFGGALSRIPIDDFFQLNFSQVSYLTRDGAWTKHFQPEALRMLFPSTFTEGVLTFNNHLNAWYIMLCQSTGPQVNITFTDGQSLFSNWTVSTVYTIPPRYNNASAGISSYAAKQHIEFAPTEAKEEINGRYVVFSYNSNSNRGFKPLVKDLSIYTPRFVQIDLDDL